MGAEAENEPLTLADFNESQSELQNTLTLTAKIMNKIGSVVLRFSQS